MPRRTQPKFTRVFAPVAGVHRQSFYQDQPPFSTYDALNVRATDPFEERIRLGRRPGLKKWTPTLLGSGTKVLMLNECRYGTGGNSLYLVASAGGKLYYGNTTAMTAVTGVTLGSTTQLASAECWGKVYICGQTSTNAIAVFDANSGSPTLTLLSAAAGLVGTPPAGTICAEWRGALVVSGNPSNPQIVYSSRTDGASTGILDWDYGSGVTSGSAWASNDPDIGTIDDDVTALIPWHNDCLLVGCKNSIYVISGHPSDGGTARILDSQVGMTDKHGWTIDKDGVLYFLSRDGIYTMDSPCGDRPKILSRIPMPLALRNTVRGNTASCMAYDLDHQGFLTWVPNYASGGQTHYWCSTVNVWGQGGIGANISFWPHTYNANYDAFSALRLRNHVPGSGEAGVIWGCRDGYIRVEDHDNATDDGTSFSDYCLYGPIALAPEGYDGVLMEMHVTLDVNSGAVKIDVLIGETPQEAVKQTTAFQTYTFSAAQRNIVVHTRARGKAVVLKAYGAVADSKWQISNIEILRKPVRKILV